jgi:psiF repeat-containing protein
VKMILKAAVIGVFAAAAAGAYAQATPEMQQLSDCNAQANKARIMKGAERKAFVDACMRGETPKKPVAAKTAKQDKTKACTKQAADKKLKGDERKKFMSRCTKA